jgi:non-heme chloroperoxidase
VSGRAPSRSSRGGGRGRLAIGAVAAASLSAALAHERSRRAWASAEDPCGPEGLRPPDGAEHVVVTDDGATLSVTVAGPDDGPSVVLAHCFLCTRAVWAGVARRLVAGGHRVTLYDHRGHGSSTLGSAPVSVSRLGTDLRAVLEDLDVSDAVIAGHSMGGMAAQAFAVEHPEALEKRARALVLCATSARPAPRPASHSTLGRALGDRAIARMPRGSLGHATVRGAFGAQVPPTEHLEFVRDGVVSTPAEARVACAVAISEMDVRPLLPGVPVPTAVMVGSRDLLTPPRHGRGIARRVPDGRFMLLRGAGHMLPMEEPDAVAQVITELAAR